MYSWIKSLESQLFIKFDFIRFSSRILIYYSFLLILLVINFPYKYIFLFNYILYIDLFIILMIVLILIKLLFFLLLIENKLKGFRKISSSFTFEFFLICIFAIIGMIGMICSNDFIIFYLSLELQSLSLYLLASSEKKLQSSVENGIKYFIMGAFASSIFLFGFSILYGFLGISSFDFLINYSVSHFDVITKNFNFFIIGFLFIFFGLLFKLGVFPFHQWLPDIYVGCDFLVVIFFIIISKLSVLIIFIKFILILFLDFFTILNYLLIFCSFFSIIIGSLGSLFQYNIRKLLAYSSITNMGYLVLIFCINSIFSVTFGILFYLNYIFCITFILCIFYLFNQPLFKKSKDDSFNIFLSYLQKDFIFSFFIIIFLFSLFGFPPFLGFFTKYYLLLILFSKKYYIFLVIIILVSILSVFYYFRLLNFYFFNLNKFSKIGYIQFSEVLSYVFILLVGFISSFILYPSFYLSYLFIWGLDFYI